MMATLVIVAAVAVMFVFAYNSILVEEVKLHQEWEKGYEAYLEDGAQLEEILLPLQDSLDYETEIVSEVLTSCNELNDLKPSKQQDDFLGAMNFRHQVKIVNRHLGVLLNTSPKPSNEMSSQEIETLERLSLRLEKIEYEMDEHIEARDEALESISGMLVGGFMGKVTSSYYYQFILSEHTI